MRAVRRRHRMLRGAVHHLCIDFRDDGTGSIYPTTAHPADLACRVTAFLQDWLQRGGIGGPLEAGTGCTDVDLPRAAAHHVCLDFHADGRVTINLATRRGDVREVAECFGQLVPQLLECPTAIHCAAGDHRG